MRSKRRSGPVASRDAFVLCHHPGPAIPRRPAARPGKHGRSRTRSPGQSRGTHPMSSGAGTPLPAPVESASTWCGLSVEAVGPLRQNALAVLGRPVEVVADHLRQRLVRIVLDRSGQGRNRDHRIVLVVEAVGVLAVRPVGELPGGLEVLRSLDDAGRHHLPADPFARRDDVDGRALLLLLDAAECERDADGELTGGGHHAGLGAGMEIDGDVLVQAVEKAPRRFLAHRLYPGRDVEVAGADELGFDITT